MSRTIRVVLLKMMSEFNGLSFAIFNITKNNIYILSIEYGYINSNEDKIFIRNSWKRKTKKREKER